MTQVSQLGLFLVYEACLVVGWLVVGLIRGVIRLPMVIAVKAMILNAHSAINKLLNYSLYK
jgi:hypothetical protein